MRIVVLTSAICFGSTAHAIAQAPARQGLSPASHETATTPAQFSGAIAPIPYGPTGPAAGMLPPPGGPAGPLGPPPGPWLRNANTGLYSTIPPGWPSIGISRRDYLHPDPKSHPRDSGIEFRVPPMSRVFVDDVEIQCKEGKYRYAPESPLIPGNAYPMRVRVETQTEFGMVAVRAITVYLRMGRITVLTFE
jgi:hypothetical protein